MRAEPAWPIAEDLVVHYLIVVVKDCMNEACRLVRELMVS